MIDEKFCCKMEDRHKITGSKTYGHSLLRQTPQTSWNQRRRRRPKSDEPNRSKRVKAQKKKKKTHTQHMATCSAVATASVCSCVLCKSLEATLWCSHWGFSCQAVWWFGQKSTWIDDGGTHHCYTERSMSVPWRYRTLILQMMPAVSRALLPCWCCSNRIQMESVSNIVEKMICEQSCVPANKLHLLKCVLVFLKG